MPLRTSPRSEYAQAMLYCAAAALSPFSIDFWNA
jgi:hypothetical protein